MIYHGIRNVLEQRIGRCHRYGQEFDIVIVNFLNERNEADQPEFRVTQR